MSTSTETKTAAALAAEIKEATTIDQVNELLGTDERKGVKDAAAKRIKEIEDAANGEDGQSAGAGASDAKTAKPNTINKIYEEFKVKPILEPVHDAAGKVLTHELKGFEKDSLKPIRTISLDPAKAEILNSQSRNTHVHLFEKEA